MEQFFFWEHILLWFCVDNTVFEVKASIVGCKKSDGAELPFSGC